MSEQNKQEPVAYVQDLDEVKRKHLVYEKGMDWKDPLYTTPPAAPVQEPVCRICNGTGEMDSGGTQPWGEAINIPCKCQAPPAEPVQDECVVCGDKVRVIPRPWVGLTKEERDNFVMDCGSYQTVADIEAKLREKNGAGQRLWIGLTQEQRNEIVFNAADEESATYQTEDNLRELNGGQS